MSHPALYYPANWRAGNPTRSRLLGGLCPPRRAEVVR